MHWRILYRVFANPMLRGGVAEFSRQSTRWSHGLNYLIVLAVVLFITWPKEQFLSLRDLPFTYNALGGASVIILAYLSLSQGARKLFGSQYLSMADWLTFAPLKAGAFVRGYAAVGLLDVAFFWSLSLPLLVLAAVVVGESLSHLGAGLLVLLVCAGAYRLVGIALLLWLERDEFLLYMVTRIVYVFFILVSGFVLPLGNPVLAFADASVWPQHLGGLVLPGGVILEGWVATVALHLLLAVVFFIIATIRGQSIQRRAATSGTAGRNPDRG